MMKRTVVALSKFIRTIKTRISEYLLSSARTGAVTFHSKYENTTSRRTNADMVVKIQTSLLPGMMVSSTKLALCVYNESKDYFAYIQPSDRNYDAIKYKQQGPEWQSMYSISRILYIFILS